MSAIVSMQIDHSTTTSSVSLKVTLYYAVVIVPIQVRLCAPGCNIRRKMKRVSIFKHTRRHRSVNLLFVCTHVPHSYTTGSKSAALSIIEIEQMSFA